MMIKYILPIVMLAAFPGVSWGKKNLDSATELSAKDTAVVLVDLQNDFTEYAGGELAVGGNGGTKEDYIEKVKAALKYFKEEKQLFVAATQDCHPQGHISFATTHKNKKPFLDTIYIDNESDKVVSADTPNTREQKLWPNHCVQETKGQKLVKGIKDFVSECFTKGKDKNLESYSGFYDGFVAPNHERNKESGLAKALQAKGIKNLIVFGLATDYCVGATAIDGVDFGFNVTFVKDLSAGVDAKTSEPKCVKMKDKGVKIITLEELKKQMK